MGKNVAVFVDVANIFYAAKAAGVDIDYVTLLKSAIAGRDFVRAYAYTGLDPDNENQRNFHNFLSRHGYKVVSKDIRKYGDGKVKANLDIELVVDMLKTARNLDVAIVVSGDGDFAPAIRAVQEMGVRVEVISFRGNTSSDLIDVADLFTDIIQIARVEKGSSRSGRRVADDGEDLSMTEVPDKLTEGTGRGRGRGTGRGRGRTGDAEREPAVAAAARPSRVGTRSRRVEPEVEVVAASGAGGGLIALPGEKLSKAALARLEAAPPIQDADELSETEGSPEEPSERDGDGPRRRRRRGGRGRGRGRGRAEGVELEVASTGGEPAAAVGPEPETDREVDPNEIVVTHPRGPRPGAFGSVWDSQIGQSRTPSVESTPFDIEDDDEPAIPEYLIAEQRRGSTAARPGRPGGRGGRGGGGYNAAVDRERYGRGGGGGGEAAAAAGSTAIRTPPVGPVAGRTAEAVGATRAATIVLRPVGGPIAIARPPVGPTSPGARCRPSSRHCFAHSSQPGPTVVRQHRLRPATHRPRSPRSTRPHQAPRPAGRRHGECPPRPLRPTRPPRGRGRAEAAQLDPQAGGQGHAGGLSGRCRAGRRSRGRAEAAKLEPQAGRQGPTRGIGV